MTGGLINDRLDGQPVNVTSELSDPSVGSWTATAPMRADRWGHTATLLPDGSVLVTGGHIHSGMPLASAERFDPRTGAWTVTGSASVGRGSHTATLLADGRVLVAGGSSLIGDGIDSAELYDPRTGAWTAAPRMGTGRQAQTATLLSDGRVLVGGGGGEFPGADGSSSSDTAEIYDPVTGRWTATARLTEARTRYAATLLPDGRVLVVGGSTVDEPIARSAERFDPDTGIWSSTSSMGDARSDHTATLLPNGTVLVAGGFGMGSTYSDLASAELFDPGRGSWSATLSMSKARSDFTATLLLDGTVLVLGDYDDASEAIVELYDPSPP